ncbi:MAG: ABC transporter ATP-binding protein [Actinomycetota bacterium]|nr:ABC transporter ATP-binding protein [Actinomycetota bacterium]
MTAAMTTDDVGRRYGSRWALRHCSLVVPEGSVVGLVGANGAGKSTLLHLAAGLLEPSVGALEVLGRRPGGDAVQLARVGFVAQDAPLYGSLTVAEHLRLGQRLNPQWDRAVATDRVSALDLALDQRAGRLSGGQRSQLALTIAMGKRPELLLLDEPVSSLDPLARRQFLQDLMALVAEHGPTVVLSTHLLSDVERVCDHLIVLAHGTVRVDGPVDELLDTHKVLTGARRELDGLPRSQQIIDASHTDRQTTVLVRTTEPILDPRWTVSEVGLEELVLAYLSMNVRQESDARLTTVRT